MLQSIMTNAPFYIKKFASDDVEQGALFRIFWYYPPKEEKAKQYGGLGLLFEVLSVDDEAYSIEHMLKMVWDAFLDAYYDSSLDVEGVNRFKLAIKAATKRLTKLMQEAELSEGLDVNIFFIGLKFRYDNDVILDKADIYLSRIGEIDAFLIRQGKNMDILEQVPNNDLIQPISAGEAQIEKDDIFVMGNKDLISSLFESEALDCSSWGSVINSLEEFQPSLFGAKKIFVLGYPRDEKFLEDGKVAISEGGTVLERIMSRLPWLAVFMETAKEKTAKLTESVKNGSIVKNIGSKADGLQDKLSKKSKQSDRLAKQDPLKTDQDKMRMGSTGVAQDDKKTVLNKTRDQTTKSGKQTIDEVPEELSVRDFKRQRSPVFKTLNKIGIQDWQVKKKILSGGLIKKVSTSLKEQIYKVKKVSPADIGFKKEKDRKKIILLIVALFLIGFFGFRIYKTITFNKESKNFAAEVESYLSFVESKVVAKEKKLSDEQFRTKVSQCVTDGEGYLSKATDLKDSTSNKTKEEDISLLENQVNQAVTNCKELYDKRFNIVRLSEERENIDILTDFKVLLGDQSNVVDIAVKKGVLYALDRGKSSVYSTSVGSNNFTKLEDPANLITEAQSVAAGEKSVFVWDAQNGIVQYSKGAGFIEAVDLDESFGSPGVLAAFGSNAYFAPQNSNIVYKAEPAGSGYTLPQKYISSKKFNQSVVDILIDGNIYIVSADPGSDGQSIYKFYGGKADTFSLREEEGFPVASLCCGFTNPSDTKPIYVYDFDTHNILAIEKPTNKKHPGFGVVKKRYIYDGSREGVFANVQSLAVDLSLNSNTEQNIYVLDGSVLWQVQL